MRVKWSATSRLGKVHCRTSRLLLIALPMSPIIAARHSGESGTPSTISASSRIHIADARRAAALAKAHIADRFVSVARAAVAAHRGIGYTWEYGLVTWFRRSLFDRAYPGSPAVHRARAADLAGW